MIAHLSDLHLLDRKSARPRNACGSLLERGMTSAGPAAALGPKVRLERLTAALGAARDAGAAHLVISGDLTASGSRAEMETLAQALHEARLDPDRVTLVPGNHDVDTHREAWSLAMAGPLARFRRASAGAEPKILERARVFLIPLDVTRQQSFPFAAGELTTLAADALERRVREVSGRGKPVVLAMHHSPFSLTPEGWNALHGLRGAERIVDLLKRYPDLHVLHGHLREESDHSVDPRRPRVFSAAAVVDDHPRHPRVRIYEALGSSLRPVMRASDASVPPPAASSQRTLAA